ncbi:hypothetical protein FR5810_01660 [Bordetella pertussis]|nr:hypothetical protein FR5810_01660 [Bordetella pertussis]
MQRQRMRPGAQVQQQALGRLLQLGAGGVERLPLHRILVRTHQQRFGRLGDGLGQAALGHFVDPLLLLFGLQALFLQRGQGGGQDVGRGRAVAALAAAMEIGRRAVQAHQQGGLLDRAGGVAEVLGRQRGRVEFLLRRALPEELQVDVLGQRGRLGHQRGRLRRREGEQGAGALDLAALARFRLNLQAGVGLGQDIAGLEAAVVVVKHVHSENPSGAAASGAPRHIAAYPYINNQWGEPRANSRTSGIQRGKSDRPWSPPCTIRWRQPG